MASYAFMISLCRCIVSRIFERNGAIYNRLEKYWDINQQPNKNNKENTHDRNIEENVKKEYKKQGTIKLYIYTSYM